MTNNLTDNTDAPAKAGIQSRQEERTILVGQTLWIPASAGMTV